MQKIGDLLQSKKETIILEGFDPVSAHGFTQVPNVLMDDEVLSPGAKLCYALLLRYAWNKDNCFPGQERMSKNLGMSKRSIVTFLKELEKVGYLEKVRRGLGKTNVYIVHCRVKSKRR